MGTTACTLLGQTFIYSNATNDKQINEKLKLYMCNVMTDFLYPTYNIENPIVKLLISGISSSPLIICLHQSSFYGHPLPNLFAPAKFEVESFTVRK